MKVIFGMQDVLEFVMIGLQEWEKENKTRRTNHETEKIVTNFH